MRRGLATRGHDDYLGAMWFPAPASPRALWTDLKAFTAGRSRVQWFAATMAIVMPLSIIVLFLLDGKQDIGPGPELIMVQSWPATRTDAQIIADQKKHQVEREAAIKERQRQFRKVDKDLERIGI
ncbi:MAG: hypothetical protein JWO25_2057 [Alphaproteobacteria bacterium]|nr:hypothetical protein [Alphaproteobacteria bacterium]MDB5721373.1 hypothetical protein [Alphaproteobacteria bacterium]